MHEYCRHITRSSTSRYLIKLHCSDVFWRIWIYQFSKEIILVKYFMHEYSYDDLSLKHKDICASSKTMTEQVKPDIIVLMGGLRSVHYEYLGKSTLIQRYRTARHLYISHYCSVIMGAMAFQIVYSTVHSGADQRKQSSAPLAFVRGIHRWRVYSPYKRPVTWKLFSFDDVII